MATLSQKGECKEMKNVVKTERRLTNCTAELNWLDLQSERSQWHTGHWRQVSGVQVAHFSQYKVVKKKKKTSCQTI